MKKLITYVLLLSIIVSCTKDELNILPPDIDWEMGFIERDIIHTSIYAIESTTDNGFVLAVNGNIRKYSSAGDSLWEKTYSESVRAIQYLNDDEYLLCGSDSTSLWIAKVNQDWEVIWETNVPIDAAMTAVFRGIEVTNDGIVIAFRKNPGIFVHSRILKLDNNGNLLWLNIFEDIKLAEIHGIDIANDGNIFIVGGASELSNTSTSPWFAKMDNNGNIIEQKIFAVDKFNHFAGVRQRSDNEYIVLIRNHSNTEIALLKDGEIHSRDFLYSSDFFMIDEMQSGEWLTIGTYGNVASLAKLDNNGNRIWQRQFESSNVDAWQSGISVCQLTDGSYVYSTIFDNFDNVYYQLTKTEIE